MGITCSIPHKGYDPNKKNNPSKADLRVSEDFSMDGTSNVVQIKISDYEGEQELEFRIRENCTGNTDYDAYGGRYYRSGDYIPRSKYRGLYISNPKYIDNPDAKIDKLGFTVDFETVEEDKSTIRFLVSSDLHLCGEKKENEKDNENEEDNEKTNKTDVKNLNTLLNRVTQLKPLHFYAVCGDLSNGSKSADESMFVDDFFSRIKNETATRCVCEGWGNHDVWVQGANFTNIKDGIRDRNSSYRSTTLSNFMKSTNGYHYHWFYDLGGYKIHFLMLNNVPGYGDVEQKPPHNGYEIDEKNPYCSLEFLETVMIEFTDKDYYVLFYHINFNQIAVSGNIDDIERWWSKKSMTDFATVIKKSKGKYMASFFGHAHGNAGKEILITDICSDLLGYRCACSDGNGAAHYLQAEIKMDDNEMPNLTVSAYSNKGDDESLNNFVNVDIR